MGCSEKPSKWALPATNKRSMRFWVFTQRLKFVHDCILGQYEIFKLYTIDLSIMQNYNENNEKIVKLYEQY